MFRRFLGGAATGLAVFCLAANAHAAVITFEDLPLFPTGWYQNELVTGGLHFADESFTIEPATAPAFAVTTPTPMISQFLEVGSMEIEPLTLALDDGGHGGAFNLASLWLGLGDWNDQAQDGFDLVTITGHKAADCVAACDDVSTTVQVGYKWATYFLSGFTDLSGVTISQPVFTVDGQPAIDPNTNTTNDLGWLALDNISYSTGAAVPEPAAWGLMIAGFGAAGAALRRRRRTAAAA